MESSHRLPALDVQKLGWHDSQVVPDLKLSMEDSTLHSVSVVAVVAASGMKTISVSIKTR